MKLNLKILIAGLTIIIMTNVIALAGVVYNRSGEPEAVVELTERELGLPYSYGLNKENSGLSLSINCRLEAPERERQFGISMTSCLGNAPWLNREKLTELGFDPQSPPEKREDRFPYDKTLPRKAYLVLEYEGAAYNRVLSKREQLLADEQLLLANNSGNAEFETHVKNAQDSLDVEQNNNSRLFAIDAGLDKTALRNKYPVPAHYIIVQALIKPQWVKTDQQNELTGRITDVMNTDVSIPLEHRSVFETLEALSPLDRNTHPPRYKLSVAFGKRGEPWVKSAEKL